MQRIAGVPELSEPQGHEALPAVDPRHSRDRAVTAVNYMLGFRRRRSSAATASGASATPPTVPAIVSDG